MDLDKIKKIYFIGIKGVGMTMLAQYLSGLGKEIVGSDVAEVFMTDQVLTKIGADVRLGFVATNIPSDTDLVIYSTAYNKSNPELAAAIAARMKVVTYAEALALVFNQSHGVAVCGSHGKTTTTAWLGFLLDKVGLSPSVMVGAFVPQFQGATLFGKSNYLIIEADEYQNKLSWFKPKIAVLNNIDYDHPDFFPDQASYTKVFADFIAKLPKNGLLVANFDDKLVKDLASASASKVVSYSVLGGAANLVASECKYHAGRQYFKLSLDGEDLGDFSIALLGRHNLANALAVISLALEIGVDLLAIRTWIGEFTGTARRLEKMGEYKGAVIIDDYAHHPTEIRATLAAVKEAYPDKKIKVLFHPHTYSRTKVLLNDFAGSFELADELIVLEIYASSRESDDDFRSASLIEQIESRQPGLALDYAEDLQKAEKMLRDSLQEGDLLLLMGAGDVFRVGERLIQFPNKL
jgi:UDP-N-acetylmuramate--alanine ligase